MYIVRYVWYNLAVIFLTHILGLKSPQNHSWIIVIYVLCIEGQYRFNWNIQHFI